MKGSEGVRWFAGIMGWIVLSGCAAPVAHDAFKLREAADEAYAAGAWSAAEKRYRRLVDRVPEDYYGYYRLGNVMAKQQRYTEAMDQYRAALELNPGEGKILSNLATVYLLQAEALIRQTYEALSATHPSRHYLQYRLAELQKITRIPVKDRTYTIDVTGSGSWW